MSGLAARGRRLRLGAWVVLLLHLLGCGEERPPPSPARFERPNRVDFVCVQDGEPVQLKHCRGDLAGNSLALHALVTQSARGEIAAVNLETQRVLDSRRDIPGYTFVPVGESPVAVVVPPTRPQRTYVADYGSRDVRVLDTNALVSPISSDPLLQRVRLMKDETVAAPVDMLLTPDESALIVAAPDVGQLFWLPLQRCDQGELDCESGLIDEAAIVAIPLQGSIDRLLMSPPEPEPAASRYEELCGLSRPEPRPLPPTELPSDPALLTAPRPSALAVNTDCPEGTTCSPRLLVADEALPVIHSLDLDLLAAGGDPASALQTPLLAGVPTRDVVVTPFVPASADGPGETQYVYAIDASDGSVLVLENGRVLSVNEDPGARPDRIAFLGGAGTANADTLEILTPEFDAEQGAEQWLPVAECRDDEHPLQEPRRLRGVFLAVALSDGSVQIVDVHDMEIRLPEDEREPAAPDEPIPAACRGCPPAAIPVLARHHLRLAENFLTETQTNVVPMNAPQGDALFRVDDVSFNVRSDGTTGSPEAPGLACIACDSDLQRAFPPPGEDQPQGAGAEEDAGVGLDSLACGGETPALICAVSDPWLGNTDIWRAIFEAQIPGTIGGAGLITLPGASESGGLELADDGVDFCRAGVLGDEDIEPAYAGQDCDGDAASALSGDQLVLITQPLSGERADALIEGDPSVREQCDKLRAALDEADARPIAFEIRRAYAHRAVISSRVSYPLGSLGVQTYEELAPCLPPGPLAFEVRTHAAFAVVGVRAGFLHRVRANAVGRCQVDRELDARMQGRARLGCTYRNYEVQFKLRLPQGSVLGPPPGLEFRTQAETLATKVWLKTTSVGLGEISVVATQLRYNPIDGLLYLVDEHARGLIPISLDPFPATVSGSYD